MCESTVFLEDGGTVREVMKDVTRIVAKGDEAVCMNIVGEQLSLPHVAFKEANLLSHSIVFARII